MTSREDEVRAQIDDLSELIAIVRLNLAGLSHDTHPNSLLRRTNLEATLATVQRELDRAMKTLDLLPGQEVTGEGLEMVKTQIREASAKTARTATRQSPKHGFDKTGAEAILSSASAKAKKAKKPKRR